MPIFEYKCQQCGNVDEFLEKASSKAKHNCEKCSAAMKKQFSTFSAKIGKGKGACSDMSPGCMGGCPNAGGCPGAMM